MGWLALIFTLASLYLYGRGEVFRGAVLGVLSNTCWMIATGELEVVAVNVLIGLVNIWNGWRALREMREYEAV